MRKLINVMNKVQEDLDCRITLKLTDTRTFLDIEKGDIKEEVEIPDNSLKEKTEEEIVEEVISVFKQT